MKPLLQKKLLIRVKQEKETEPNEEDTQNKLILKKDNLDNFLEKENNKVLVELISKKSIKIFGKFKISTEI